MTHEDIVYDRRVRVINHAAKIGNVAEACRVFGVSRKTYYEWVKKAEQYGLSALLPKGRRVPHQPNAMSSEEIAVILSEAVARPTLGPKSLLRHLRARGVDRSASGVAKVLRRHNLGTAKQRIVALASLTAAETGQVTEQALEGPFGFCLFASQPGEVVALDTFYVGRLKGLGAVWQLTAVDVATRTAVCQLIVGDKTATVAAAFLDHLKKALRKHGITLSGVLTDNGPEFVGKGLPGTCRGTRAGPSPDPATLAQPQRGLRTVPRHRAARVLPTALPPRPRRRHRPAGPVAASVAGRLQPAPPQPR